MLETDIPINPTRWSDLLRHTLQARLNTSIPDDPSSIFSAIKDLTPKVYGGTPMHELLDSLTWFGIVPATFFPALSPQTLLSNMNDLPVMPTKPAAPIDLFATLLAHKLRYLPNERDMVILSHEIVCRTTPFVPSSPSQPVEEEIHTSSLIATGTSTQTSMSVCVGLPVAFATRTVLDGHVNARGVCGPGVEKGVWKGVLNGLASVGLGMKESVKIVKSAGGGDVERCLLDARMKLDIDFDELL